MLGMNAKTLGHVQAEPERRARPTVQPGALRAFVPNSETSPRLGEAARPGTPRIYPSSLIANMLDTIESRTRGSRGDARG